MGSPSPPTDSGIGVSPPTQVRQPAHHQPKQQLKTRVVVTHSNSNSNNSKDDEEDEELVRFGVEEANLMRRRRAISSDDTASLCSSALSVESDTSGSRYDNVLRQRIPSLSTETSQPVTPAKTSTLVAAAAEIAAASYLTGSTPVATGPVAPGLQSGDEDGDDEDTDSNSDDSENLDLDSYSDECDAGEDSDHEKKEDEKPDKFRKPGLRLPLHRNSGPYENFKPEPKCDEEPASPPYSSAHSAEGSCSSSSFSSNSSSPKMIEKKSSKMLKRGDVNDGSFSRPELPPRENGSHMSFNTARHLQQQQQQHPRRVHNNHSSVEGLTSVVSVGGNSPNDSSIRHFLAAGQTSNV